MGTKSTGSDERRIGFFMIHNGIVDSFGLTPYEGWLYVIIARHVNQKTGIAFPSLVTLAREGCMSRSQVLRCLKTLSQKGLLEITHHRQKGKNSRAANHYRLLEPPTPDAKVVPDRHQENPDLVPDRHQGSTHQVPGIVPDRHPNNTNMNKTKEQDIAAASKNDAAARAAEPKAKTRTIPPKTRPRDPIFDAIAECSFSVPVGAEVAKDTAQRVGKVKREVLTIYPDVTERELRGAYSWHVNVQKLTAPRDAVKVVTMVGVYRAQHRPAAASAIVRDPDCAVCGGTGLVLPALGAYEDGDPRANTPIQCPVCVKAARASEAQREAVGP